jgi:hypothetical protein
LLPNESERISSVFYPSNPEGVKPGRILRIFDSYGFGRAVQRHRYQSRRAWMA